MAGRSPLSALRKRAEDFPIFFHDPLGDLHIGEVRQRLLPPRHHFAGGGELLVLVPLIVGHATALLDFAVVRHSAVGEFVAADNPNAYGCINSKRVDLLLVDGDCRARHAIEYQGTGHHQGTAAARDAVKKEALRKAGIGYDEVVAGKTTPSDLKRLVEKVVAV